MKARFLMVGKEAINVKMEKTRLSSGIGLEMVVLV